MFEMHDEMEDIEWHYTTLCSSFLNMLTTLITIPYNCHTIILNNNKNMLLMSSTLFYNFENIFNLGINVRIRSCLGYMSLN